MVGSFRRKISHSLEVRAGMDAESWEKPTVHMSGLFAFLPNGVDAGLKTHTRVVIKLYPAENPPEPELLSLLLTAWQVW